MPEEHRVYVSKRVLKIVHYAKEQILGLPTKGFLGIKAVAIHRDGTLYIANKDSKVLHVITKQDDTLTISKNVALNRPDGVTIDYNTNSLIVSESYHHKIVQIDLSTWSVQLITGRPATAPKKAEDGPFDTASFYYPKGAALDSKGHIYVCESAKRVRKIDRENFIVSTLIGQAKDDPGSTFLSHCPMQFPLSIQSDHDGNLYVCDRDEFAVLYWNATEQQHSILIKNGREIPSFVEGPCEEATLGTVTYIALDPKEKYLYAKTKTAIYQIDLRKKWVRTLLYQSNADICGFGVDPRGNLWILELYGAKFVVLSQPLPWKIARLLWIGNKKEHTSSCVLAWVPKEIIFEIIYAANQME